MRLPGKLYTVLRIHDLRDRLISKMLKQPSHQTQRSTVAAASWTPSWPHALPFSFIVTRHSVVHITVMRMRTLFRDSVLGAAMLAVTAIPVTTSGVEAMDALMELCEPATSTTPSVLIGCIDMTVRLAGHAFGAPSSHAQLLHSVAIGTAPAVAISWRPASVRGPAQSSPGAVAAQAPAVLPQEPSLPPNWQEVLQPRSRIL